MLAVPDRRTVDGAGASLSFQADPHRRAGWPGGITDIVARIAGARLSERVGQPVVIDNKSGASGLIGTEVVARAVPDGYTLLMVYHSHPVNPALKQHLPYDTIKDFVGVTTLTTVSLVLLVPPAFPAQTVQELIALSRKERLTFASVATTEIAMERRVPVRFAPGLSSC